ncbi:MAG: ion transporter [Flavobacteriaceae bacterium]|nr:ion transporter [Flavobacteriaceae bacterium]
MKKFKHFDTFIYTLIVLNILAMILESHESIQLQFSVFFQYFELISISIFSFEYLFRIYINYKEERWTGVKKYVFSFFGIIDLISILPFYIKKFVLLDGRFFRILRLFRLSRIFKLGRGSKSLKLFTKAIGEVKSELYFTLFLSLLTILFSASAIYFLEHDAQPEIFSSITASIWWATVSLATVGYGDIVPITVWGKVFASIISLIGIGVVAIPTGIISASFVSEINSSKENH